ncbi:MAG: DUF2760 domain-containing protein [Acidobacteriota bacterium]|nr:DUF2760 domain-containing protein [Acidobacteriota bacterium]
MLKISLAFRCFWALLSHGQLTPELLAQLGLARKVVEKAAPPPPPPARVSDGALQLLTIFQRDGRLLDFFLEDITSYTDDQVGSAARSMHTPCRDALNRYFTIVPVIDGVEGTFVPAPSKDPSKVKFLGNVPASPPAGGVLRHRGWAATNVQLPALLPKQDLSVLAPAELEVE